MQINLVDLVLEIREAMQVRIISTYEETLSSEILDSALGESANAIRFYQALSEEHKTMVLSIVRQVTCNTVSTLLAWVDGIYFLPSQSKELELRYEGEINKLNGDLTDIWWQIEEGEDIAELIEFYKDS